MSNPGYNMGSNRSREFTTFVSSVEDRYLTNTNGDVIVNNEVYAGPNADEIRLFKTGRMSYGNLRFDDRRVYSYNMLIAVVWPKEKVITWNEDARARSRTTSLHLGAILGASISLTGRFVPRVSRASTTPGWLSASSSTGSISSAQNIGSRIAYGHQVTSGRWDPVTRTWKVKPTSMEDKVIGGYVLMPVSTADMDKNPYEVAKSRWKVRSIKAAKEMIEMYSFLDGIHRRDTLKLHEFVKNTFGSKTTRKNAVDIALKAYAKSSSEGRKAMRGFMELTFEKSND